MPKSFQDAIAVTHQLGLRWLWVDSLCIIQDDVLDWQHESSKMAAVYSNAAIVIGASRSPADSQGFLLPYEIGPFVQIPNSSEDNQKTAIHLQSIPDCVCYVPLITGIGDPLDTRAWALQEMVLAKRKVLFQGLQAIWECRTLTTAEDGRRIPSLTANTWSLFRKPEDGPAVKASRREKYRLWYKLVLDYWNRLLTKLSDKFPAIAGLAEIVARALGEEYCARLWSGDIISGLLWRKLQFGTLLPSAVYRAPSWSWASLDGWVIFVAFSIFGPSFWEYVVSVEDWHVETIGDSPYGQVKSGWLKLSAPIFPIVALRGPYTDDDFYEQHPGEWKSSSKGLVITYGRGHDSFALINIGGKILAIAAALDFLHIDVHNTERLSVLFLLQLPDEYQEYQMRNWEGTLGLIVRRTDTRDYLRVGMVHGKLMLNDETMTDKEMCKFHRSCVKEDFDYSTHKSSEPCGNNKWKQVDFKRQPRTTITII